MADAFKASIDMSGAMAGLEALRGPGRESLMRKMLVEAGVVLRDKAKQNVAISEPPYNPNSRGSQQPGTLQRSIYLAFDKESSNATVFKYNISWNNKKAWWGKLIEFGYIRTHHVGVDAQGNFYTDMSRPLDQPKPVSAKPFLRPALDGYGSIALNAGMQRGVAEFPKLLQESMKP